MYSQGDVTYIHKEDSKNMLIEAYLLFADAELLASAFLVSRNERFVRQEK
ncbi:MAG: hypothetical protein NVS4B11_11870 [Ktedonobacteraceae bacterium]